LCSLQNHRAKAHATPNRQIRAKLRSHARATKAPAAVSSDQTTYRHRHNVSVRKTLSVTTTAYTHTAIIPPGVGPGRHDRVDKSVIPWGQIYVPGYGFGIAQDSGVSGIILIYLWTPTTNVPLGQSNQTIYILE
jgi:3D (Asp-Asp-Asp) domain-containing protein